MSRGEVAVEVLVEVLAGNPSAARKLLSEHIDDGSRHCRVCQIGSQAGRKRWPCILYLAAEHAVNRILERHASA